ncbi:MAG: cation:H+ antiporter [Saprospiraceae bacterium]|jgi:cation:H+ antiporter
MATDIFLIFSGFVLLIFGANWLVEGASGLAKKWNISDLAIGLTIVAFGTSAPELVVNSIASVENHSNIILGNVIGSNNFNLFVILGIVGLIYPIQVQSNTVWREIPISLVAVLSFFLLANNLFIGESQFLSRLDGIILFILFLAFLFYVYKNLENDKSETPPQQATMSNFKVTGLVILGLGGLILGGKMVVDNAVQIASDFGISEKIIGLTIIAAGTSLPELVTSVVAAFKKNSDIAIGNLIGSNIFNVLLVIPVSISIRPFYYNSAFNLEFSLLIAGTIFLFIAMFTGTKKKLDRWEAGVLLGTFICYTIYQILGEV